MSKIALIYTLVSNLVVDIYSSIYYRYFNKSCQVKYIHIPDNKIPNGVLDIGISLYNTGYIRGKGFRVIHLNYNSRRMQ